MKLDIKLGRLHEALKLVGPVVGIDGTINDVDVVYDPQPTVQQEDAVEAAIAAFDWSDAADNAWLDNNNPNRKTLKDQAIAAINRLDQIKDAPNPNMTTLAQVINALNNQVFPAIRDMALYEKNIIKRLIDIL